MTEVVEEWRGIPGWEGLYEASSLGRVKSLPREVRRRNRWGGENLCVYRERVLSPAKNAAEGGYFVLQLSDERGRHTHSVHALVCAAFHGSRPDGKQAAHGNGDRSDNRSSNLRWATPTENEADKISHERTVRGERNGGARLVADQVEEIRQLKCAGHESRDLGQRFGVGTAQINAICARRRWKHLAVAA